MDDAELASDIMTAAYPPLPQDPIVTRNRWASPRHGFAYGRFIAERDGRPLAFLGWVHGPWSEVPDAHCEVEVWPDRGAGGGAVLTELITWIGDRAAAEQARVLLAYCGEDEPDMLAALGELGYTRERTEKVWELDLAANGPRLIEAAREAERRVKAAGLRFVTFADWHDPERIQKLYELHTGTVNDIPHTLAIVPETPEDFEARFSAPDRLSDRYWIVLDADRPVALSFLKFPPVRGTVWTGYTCTASDYRGRGLARAVKLQSLAQAAELGVPLVCTDNDSENRPILKINEELGYRLRPGFVEHHKRVTSNGHA